MGVLATAIGLLLIVVNLSDAFETIVLPRRVTRRFRLTRLYRRLTWTPWSALARRMGRSQAESFLSVYGPLSLIILLALWAAGLVVGFALLDWGLGVDLDLPGGRADLGTTLYLSGTTFFTLGYGDITPTSGLGRGLAVVEAGTGFGFLAAVISYLPVLYQAFSQREVHMSLLDARAGSPPVGLELLRRCASSREAAELDSFLHDWERWAAELLESHLSYPVLAYFRSQHDSESWLAALTAILDACALLLVGVEAYAARQAYLTLAIARHAAVDLCQIFLVAPRPPKPDRLGVNGLEALRSALAAGGLVLRGGEAAAQRLEELRRLYEPYVNALAEYLIMPLPPWIPAATSDDWRSSAWELGD